MRWIPLALVLMGCGNSGLQIDGIWLGGCTTWDTPGRNYAVEMILEETGNKTVEGSLRMEADEPYSAPLDGTVGGGWSGSVVGEITFELEGEVALPSGELATFTQSGPISVEGGGSGELLRDYDEIRGPCTFVFGAGDGFLIRQ